MSELDYNALSNQLFRPETIESMMTPASEADNFPDLSASSALPDELPILPLRGVVVYPLTAVPLTVGQPRSIQLIDDAVLNKKIIGLVASKDPNVDEPSPDQCYTDFYHTSAVLEHEAIALVLSNRRARLYRRVG